MNFRVLAWHKPDASLPPRHSDPSDKPEQVAGHIRRRRHTPDNHQDRLLRRLTRILIAVGVLMMIWLLLRALGWV